VAVTPLSTTSLLMSNDNGSGDDNNNNDNKNLSASQQARREEEKRQQERKNDVVIGKTSAIPGEQNFPIDPDATVREYLAQATPLEREVYLEGEKGMSLLQKVDLEGAAKAFNRVFELQPQKYLWQAGIVFYYLGDYKRASEIFARCGQRFETRFEEYASEERIWRSACELKYLSQLDSSSERQALMEDRDKLAEHIQPFYVRHPESDPLEGERRKVIRIARNLFESTTNNDESAVLLARAKLRSIGGKGKTLLPDLKYFKLESWYYLGLYYDAIGDEEEAKKCMKVALRTCPYGSWETNMVHAFPYIHMVVRDWLDDDEFDEKKNPLKDVLPEEDEEVPVPEGVQADPLFVQTIREGINELDLTQLEDAMKVRGLPSGGKEEMAERLFRVLLEDVGLQW